MNITGSLQTALTSVVNFVPKAVAFLVILIIGWIVAKVVRAIITKLLAKIGADRIGERSNIHRYTGKYTLSKLTGTLAYLMIWLFTLQIAFNAFGPNPVSVVINDLVGWIPQLFIAGIIMVVGFLIADAAFKLISDTMANLSYGKVVARVVQVMVLAVAVIAALGQIGIATTVTTPILITALAMIAGVVIVGVGGGLIFPMRERWERMLTSAESEATNAKAAMADRKSQRIGSEPMAQPAYSSSQYSSENVQQSQEPAQTQSQQSSQPPQSAAGSYDPTAYPYPGTGSNQGGQAPQGSTPNPYQQTQPPPTQQEPTQYQQPPSTGEQHG